MMVKSTRELHLIDHLGFGLLVIMALDCHRGGLGDGVSVWVQVRLDVCPTACPSRLWLGLGPFKIFTRHFLTCAPPAWQLCCLQG